MSREELLALVSAQAKMIEGVDAAGGGVGAPVGVELVELFASTVVGCAVGEAAGEEAVLACQVGTEAG